jgi:diaminopimelate epimerase
MACKLSAVRIAVTKMHGARNDFVVIDRRRKKNGNLPSFARWACDRHAGIGADGVISIESSGLGDARMRIFNTDGSEAEMCGNGIRCAARWLDEVEAREGLTFETDAGLIATQIVSRGREYAVRVSMGRPQIDEIFVSALGSASFVELGNPHVVFFRHGVNDLDLEIAGPQLQRDPAFPNGANVHVAAPGEDGLLKVRHWERGVGLTLACGTGAVACATVAIRNGMAVSPVELLVPGGRLTVEWNGSGIAYLTGPAVRVFDTEVDLGHEIAP